jgi:hypothetical protein
MIRAPRARMTPAQIAAFLRAQTPARSSARIR